MLGTFAAILIVTTLVLTVSPTYSETELLPQRWCRSNVAGVRAFSFHAQKQVKWNLDLANVIEDVNSITKLAPKAIENLSNAMTQIKGMQIKGGLIFESVNPLLRGKVGKIIEAPAEKWTMTCYNTFNGFLDGAIGHSILINRKDQIDELKALMDQFHISTQPILAVPTKQGFVSKGQGRILAPYASTTYETVKDGSCFAFDKTANTIGKVADGTTVKGICVGDVPPANVGKEGNNDPPKMGKRVLSPV